ncbi:MAG TPA: IS200/IS605 family transposase [Thermomicrobiales bacterium]|nr:IS200/IS605 family transposase [Thermomicrobiales bacterium]
MRRTYLAVFVHLVWTTWDRLPLISKDCARQIYRAIGAKCRELRAAPVAIGGVEDHVHLLVELPATVSLAELVGQVKGASAHLVTHQLTPGEFFKWQGAYAAFSVSPTAVTRVRDYIVSQREHHATGSTLAEWEPPQMVTGDPVD